MIFCIDYKINAKILFFKHIFRNYIKVDFNIVNMKLRIFGGLSLDLLEQFLQFEKDNDLFSRTSSLMLSHLGIRAEQYVKKGDCY